jgi:hypothetical protein
LHLILGDAHVALQAVAVQLAPAGLAGSSPSTASINSPTPMQAENSRGALSRPVYVKDGRIYHHKVSGSSQMANFGMASAAIAAEKAGLGPVHGLGAGGNVPAAPSLMAQVAARSKQQSEQELQLRQQRRQQQQQQQSVCSCPAWLLLV